MSAIKMRQGFVGQRGAALVVGLIFLAMLSLMGVAAYMVAVQEERMSGNTRDRIRAFEAAEASLRDCESVVRGAFLDPEKLDGSGGTHSVKFNDEETWLSDRFVRGEKDRKGEDIKVREISAKLPDVAEQPRCIIEAFDRPVEVTEFGDAVSGPQRVKRHWVYRITAIGVGANRNTRADLQSMYRRTFD